MFPHPIYPTTACIMISGHPVVFALPTPIALVLLSRQYTFPSVGPMRANMLQDALRISVDTWVSLLARG